MRCVRLPRSLPDRAGLGFVPGSTGVNRVPHTAVELLQAVRDTLGDRSQLLIGIERSKDVDRLVAAYDDTQGVTARFNLNLLDRINRELGGNVPSGRLRHVTRWNAKWSRIEMHLEAIDALVF